MQPGILHRLGSQESSFVLVSSDQVALPVSGSMAMPRRLDQLLLRLMASCFLLQALSVHAITRHTLTP
uniref:Uncharacterized protein n=1 Tax=Aegilops tauschii subsp. strangulata TaxID=200361 RepID=A0A453HS83_AEGTS